MSPYGRVWLLALALFAVTAALLADLAHSPDPRHSLHLSVVALAILFAVAEGVRLHVTVRNDAQSVTLTDVVVVVAMFTVSPLHAVLLRLAGGGPVALWLYRRSLIRLVFNIGVMAAETAVAGVVLTSLARVEPTSPHAWIGVLVAGPASGLVSALAVVVAIAMTSRRQSLRAAARGLMMGGTVSAVAATLGLVCAIVAGTNRHGWWLVVVVALIGLVVYRGYGRLLERQLALEAVHTFSRMLDQGHDSIAMLEVVLRQVPGLINATNVEMVLLDENGLTRRRLLDDAVTVETNCHDKWQLQEELESGRPQLLCRGNRRTSARQLLRGEPAEVAMMAPLPNSAVATGALIATDRIGRVRGFRRRDLLLFETLARHAGEAMTRLGLVEQLRHDVDHDRPTGLLNRHGLETTIADLGASRAALLLLRFSGVREVNDALGHEAGERLLRAAAQRIRAHLRETTSVGRLDGDVFAVLLGHRDADEAERVADRLLDMVTDPFELDDVPLALDAVVGVAVGEASPALIRQAEIALQTAQRGATTVAFYDATMEPPNVRRLSVASELRRALADRALAQQIVPFYQPQANLMSGRIEGVEALVRWQHPDRGLIPPCEFIPVVESTDLVRPLTLHVLNRALADAARWARDDIELHVAVNLSARSLYDSKLVRDVADLLALHAVAPESLILEITESAVMDDADRARDLLEDLAAIGVRLSVDDFGTGYSSLAYLARLPVSEVKVDRAFVSRMTSDTKDAAIVRSVIDLGHNLNMRVVAEGVEDRTCWDALAGFGADIAQGFLLSRPLPADAFESWLAEHDADAFRRGDVHLRVASR